MVIEKVKDEESLIYNLLSYLSLHVTEQETGRSILKTREFQIWFLMERARTRDLFFKFLVLDELGWLRASLIFSEH